MSEDLFNELGVIGTVWDDTKATILDGFPRARKRIDEFREYLKPSGQNVCIHENLLPYPNEMMIILGIAVYNGDFAIYFPKYFSPDGVEFYYGIRTVLPNDITYLVVVDTGLREYLFKVKGLELANTQDCQVRVTELELVGPANKYGVYYRRRDGTVAAIPIGFLQAIAVGEIVKWLILAGAAVVGYKLMNIIEKWLEVRELEASATIEHARLLEKLYEDIKNDYEQGKISKEQYHETINEILDEATNLKVESEQGESISDKIYAYIKELAVPIIALFGMMLTFIRLKILVDVFRSISDVLRGERR